MGHRVEMDAEKNCQKSKSAADYELYHLDCELNILNFAIDEKLCLNNYLSVL